MLQMSVNNELSYLTTKYMKIRNNYYSNIVNYTARQLVTRMVNQIEWEQETRSNLFDT